MREIKYRVWSIENRTYHNPKEGCYYAMDEDGELDFYCHGDQCGSCEPEKYIIEQFTGLKDKNGKEIYEGDIVEEDIDFNSKMADGTFRYKVYWNEDELCWSLDPIGPASIHNDLWELNSSCRVIGNIHENP